MRADRYAAFVSYSHADRVFAERLHTWLEGFEVPDGLAATSLRPVFRDDEELAAGSLSENLRQALTSSNALVVVCSTSAARSRWVAEEVRFFRKSNKARVFGIVAPGNEHLPLRRILPASMRPFPWAWNKSDLFLPHVDEQGEKYAFLRLAAGLLEVPVGVLTERVAKREADLNEKRGRAYMLSSVDGLLSAFSEGESHHLVRGVVELLSRSAQRFYGDRNSMLAAALGLAREFSVPSEIIQIAASITATAFAQSGKRAALVTDGPSIILYDAETWSRIAMMEGHTSTISVVEFAPDGQTILSASDDNTLRLWDGEGRELARMLGHEGGLTVARYSKDGGRIVTCGRDLTARLWDAHSGMEVARLGGFKTPVVVVAFSDDGVLALGETSGTLSIVGEDMSAPRQISPSIGTSPIALAFNPDASELACAYQDGSILVKTFA